MEFLLQLFILVLQVLNFLHIPSGFRILFGSFAVKFSPEQFKIILSFSDGFFEFLDSVIFFGDHFLKLNDFIILVELLAGCFDKDLVVGFGHE